MNSIVFTGGGTTGHVTKNLILIDLFREQLPEVKRHYLGIKTGKEASLVSSEIAEFHPISSGKLRRYFSLKTVPDFFRFFRGIWQSYWILGGIKPKLVFSSGGYVALPVALAAKLRRIPVLSHETDSYPGLANRIIAKVAEKIFLGYQSAAEYLPKGKTHFVGNPISKKLFKGSRERALKSLGFGLDKPVLMVMGGSQGAKQINELVWRILPELSEEWQIVHLTGKGDVKMKMKEGDEDLRGYRHFEYVKDEYIDYLTAADLMITRGGGNSLAEIAALDNPAIVIPLPLPAAAGDHQRKNAEEMCKNRSDWQNLYNPTHNELLDAIKKAKNQLKTGEIIPRIPQKLPQYEIFEVLRGYLA
jgi:UDP-N-acetylglucosamine--N-acetylmuramyl-(pentapeptide) pyrophosphoryl-undecaprenol N-acetylglucosamine transferase